MVEKDPIRNNLVDELVKEFSQNLTTCVNDEMTKLNNNVKKYIDNKMDEISLRLKEIVKTNLYEEEAKKEQIEKLSKNKILLDVGGVHYSTTLSTLTKYKDSKLSKMFSGDYKLECDKEGRFFIDANGKAFEYVLESIRNDTLVVPSKDEDLANAVKMFIKKFEITGLIREIERIEEIKEIKEIKFELDPNCKHSNITLMNNNLTALKSYDGHSSVLGSVRMSSGVYSWDVFVDDLKNNYWVGIGVADKNDITKDLTNDHVKSYMIGSGQQLYNMAGTNQQIQENATLSCRLDFEKDQFTIKGPGIEVKNNVTFKGKELYVIFDLYAKGNKVSIRNFKRIE